MKPLPLETNELRARVMTAVIGDILDPHPNSRIAALRASMITRDGDYLEASKRPDGRWEVQL